MEHTKIINASELEDYANRKGRDCEEVIPELVFLLVKASVLDLTTCRIPYGDSIGLPGLDGRVETENGYPSYVPKDLSFWEIGKSGKPIDKATADYKKRTYDNDTKHDDDERKSASYIFVTPHSRAWSATSQSKWLKSREGDGWKKIDILDGVKLADWIREFPAIGKWLAAKIGISGNANGFLTVAEHWTLLPNISSDPKLPPQLFLTGREKAIGELDRLFRGELTQLLLATYSENDAEDFIAAFLETLDPKLQQEYINKCLFINDPDTWNSLTNLKTPHIFVASPRLDLESNERLHMAARNRGHRVVIPISDAWSLGRETLVSLPNPSKNAIETALIEGGFTTQRARELAEIGNKNLSSLKRHLRGLGELPPYATWENAVKLAQAGLFGKWQEDNSGDLKALEDFLGKSYGEWIEVVKAESLRVDTPLIQHNGRWKMISRGEAWSALGVWISNDDLERFEKTAISVLEEIDPRLELLNTERYAASIHGKVLTHSESLRDGLAESLALLGSRHSTLSKCSKGKPEVTARKVVHQLLSNATWQTWASLKNQLPLLAEAAPDEFLEAVETALLEVTPSPFHELFAQESSGFGGDSYIAGVLWALETLAWSPKYLIKATFLLGELAAMDPGGNWSNRPKGSLVDIYLPWFPQTVATVNERRAAILALTQEQPDVGWQVLMNLLPNSHQSTSGTRKPTWRDFIPKSWKEGVTNNEYWQQCQIYSELVTKFAAQDLEKLIELIEHLPNLASPAFKEVVQHLSSTAIVSLPEVSRIQLWEKLVELTSKHRAYAEADWAMPKEVIDELEETASKLAPESNKYKLRRLFTENDFELYESHSNFEEEGLKLEGKRQFAIIEIMREGGFLALLEFINNVDSPRKIGWALGNVEQLIDDATLLSEVLLGEDKKVNNFVHSFILGRINSKGWVWADEQLNLNWSVKEKSAFLKFLPFVPDTWRRVEVHLEQNTEDYWNHVNPNPWGLEEDALLEAANHLVSNKRFNHAIECLYLLNHKNVVIPIRLAGDALNGLISSNESASRIDQHHLVEVIKWLQKNEPEDSEILFQIEWKYLPILDRLHDGEPKVLESRLASDPEFFFQIITAVFRSEKDKDIKKDITEAERAVAQNAYRLLHNWKRVPGLNSNGSLSESQFKDWIDEVRKLTAESGHLKVAMSQIGQTLSYSPADPAGLWIHESVARALNARDAAEMRNGFTTGLFNQRGVYGFSGGKEELKIAHSYHEKAKALAEHGYHRLSDSIRMLAEEYEREALRESSRNEQE